MAWCRDTVSGWTRDVVDIRVHNSSMKIKRSGGPKLAIFKKLGDWLPADVKSGSFTFVQFLMVVCSRCQSLGRTRIVSHVTVQRCGLPF